MTVVKPQAPEPASPARRFGKDRAGNVAIIGAAFLSTAMVIAAFAVDEGALYLEKRHSQNLTDIAVIAAASNPAKAELAVLQTLQDNGMQADRPADPKELREWLLGDSRRLDYTIEPGTYSPDPMIAPDKRFVANQSPTNAVKVTLRKRGTLFFAERLIDKPMIATSGIAYASSEAAFSVGSRLLSLDGGLLNALLNGLLGTELSLRVMDYKALLDVHLDALQFISGLATELDITAGTYNDVLEASATVGEIASVMADLAGPLDLTAAGALRKIANDKATAELSLPLGSLLELGTFGTLSVGSHNSGTIAAVDALQMLTAVAMLANGKNQIALDLGLTVPGVANTVVKLAIGEPAQKTPWMVIGDGGEIVRTAQTRLLVEAKVGGSGLLAGVSVRLPVYLELAYAEAQLASISCPTGRVESTKVAVDAKPGVAELWIGDIDAASFGDFTKTPVKGKVNLVDITAIKIAAKAHVAATNTQTARLVFNYQDIKDLNVKSVSTKNTVDTVVSSLLGELELDVNVVGLTLGLPALVTGALQSTLSGIAAPLDTLVYNLLLALGIKIGEADVRVHGAHCQRSVLVQ